jgi:hypothetical protein
MVVCWVMTSSSDTLVSTYQTTRGHNPEYYNLNNFTLSFSLCRGGGGGK